MYAINWLAKCGVRSFVGIGGGLGGGDLLSVCAKGDAFRAALAAIN